MELIDAAQESVQIILSKREIIGDIKDVINLLCVCEERELLLGYLSLQNLPYRMHNGTNMCTSQQTNARRTQILCIGIGYSQQLR